MRYSVLRATPSARAASPGVLNNGFGFGIEAGKPLAASNRIRKIAFTGETTTGRLIMQYASENIINVTLELGGKSPNVFFEDAYRAGRAIEVGRVWTNCYNLYPAHAAFGGYKNSGIGRETTR